MNNEALRDLEKQLSDLLTQSAETVKKLDVQSLYNDYNKRIFLSNEAFLKEVKNFSIICVAAAPFSLTLLLSDAGVEKTLLILAFVFFIINILFLNIGEWYLNSKIRQSTASQFLEILDIDLSVSDVLNEGLDSGRRVEALATISQSELQLDTKKKFEPIEQEKILRILRNFGLLIFVVAMILLIFSVIPIFKL